MLPLGFVLASEYPSALVFVWVFVLESELVKLACVFLCSYEELGCYDEFLGGMC